MKASSVMVTTGLLLGLVAGCGSDSTSVDESGGQRQTASAGCADDQLLCNAKCDEESESYRGFCRHCCTQQFYRCDEARQEEECEADRQRCIEERLQAGEDDDLYIEAACPRCSPV